MYFAQHFQYQILLKIFWVFQTFRRFSEKNQILKKCIFWFSEFCLTSIAEGICKTSVLLVVKWLWQGLWNIFHKICLDLRIQTRFCTHLLIESLFIGPHNFYRLTKSVRKIRLKKSIPECCQHFGQAVFPESSFSLEDYSDLFYV